MNHRRQSLHIFETYVLIRIWTIFRVSLKASVTRNRRQAERLTLLEKTWKTTLTYSVAACAKIPSPVITCRKFKLIGQLPTAFKSIECISSYVCELYDAELFSKELSLERYRKLHRLVTFRFLSTPSMLRSERRRTYKKVSYSKL